MKNFIATARRIFKSRINVNMSDEYLEDMFYADKDYWAVEAAYLSTDSYDMDTAPRDNLLEQFALKEFGVAWPCYGDSQDDIEAFNQKLRKFKEANS